jgi:hypothetical protein
MENLVTHTKTIVLSCMALACLCLLTAFAPAQTLQWKTSAKYDDGIRSTVALNSSNLILEVHQAEGLYKFDLWYHVGRLVGGTVQWGKSQYIDVAKEPHTINTPVWPTVAVTKDNYVILLYSTGRYKSGSSLRYSIGRLYPDGGVDQSIQWLLKDQIFDSGFHSSVAVNDNGVIAEVHESGSGGTGLYYRVGHMRNPDAGQFDIVWVSGSAGLYYDSGVNPHIAMNKAGNVVEMHQVTGESLLHYRRGVLKGNGINFYGAPRYSSNASNPAVALTDFALALAIDTGGGRLESSAGYLNPNDPNKVDWQSTQKVDYQGFNPGIATNGDYIIATWNDNSDNLLYSTARVP